jgi:hypothetical protein
MTKLIPLLLPSGPRWDVKYSETWGLPALRYWGRRWRVERHGSFSDSRMGVQEFPEGCLICVPDEGTFWGRLWWRHIVPLWVRVLWHLGSRPRANQLGDKCGDYPFGGAELSWRFYIVPGAPNFQKAGEPETYGLLDASAAKVWRSGDNGSPIFIAVFGDDS